MKKNKTIISLAAIFFSCFVLSQQVDAASSTGSVRFSSSVRLGRIKASRSSSLRVASARLQSSRIGSTLTMDSHVQIGGPVTLKENSHFNGGALTMNNGYIGGSATMRSNVHVRGSINGEADSDIGIGGMQITADDDYNPQQFNTNTSGVIGNMAVSSPSHSAINMLPQSGTSPPTYLPGTIWDNEKTTGLKAAEKWIASAAYTLGMSRQDWERYDKQYQRTITLYYAKENYLRLYKRAKLNGNTLEAEKYKKLFFETNKRYNEAFTALNALHDENFEQPMRVSKTVYELAKYSSTILAKATGNPAIDRGVDVLFKGLDYAVNYSELGSIEARNRLFADVITDVLFEIPFSKGKSISDIIENTTGPLVRQSGAYQSISSIMHNQKTRADIIRTLHAVIEKSAEDTLKYPLQKKLEDNMVNSLMNSIEQLGKTNAAG